MNYVLKVLRFGVQNENLVPWVKFLWQLEAVDANAYYKLLPTDCVDVILNLTKDMVYETDSKKIIAPPFHINGLRSKYTLVYQQCPIHVFGISFSPFGLFPFVHKPLTEIRDKIVDLHELSDSLAQKLRVAVSGSSAEEVFASIEQALCEELSADQESLENAKLIYDFISANGSVTMLSFCQEKGLSTKTFERVVSKYTGYTPKILGCMRRFQNASNQLVHQPPENLSEVAYFNNYTDQAHFIKDFQRFSGTSPRLFQQEKSTVKENTKYTYR